MFGKKKEKVKESSEQQTESIVTENTEVNTETKEEIKPEKKKKERPIDTSQLSLEELIESIKDTLFSEINDEINDDSITDIEWDGDGLWLTQLGKGCFLSDKKLSDEYIDNLSIRLSDIMKENFNQANPVLEAHTETLRISIIHESRSTKKSITIRKLPLTIRYTHEQLVEAKTLPEPILNLLENCIIAHCNAVIGGKPHAGKTELLKYLTSFIPANEKVMTLEDNAEIHYKQLHPNKKSTPLYIDEAFNYTAGIRACLRQNADWLLLSEARGNEVSELLNALSTGLYCMTTLHTDSVADMPDRLFNMLSDQNNSRFINNVYRYVKVGLVISADKKEHREVEDFGFFEHDIDGTNTFIPFYNSFDGVIPPASELPKSIKKALTKAGITDPYKRPEIYESAVAQKYIPPVNAVKTETTEDAT